MVTLNEKEIRYLALEGGGGKGVVYKGMIRALEEIGLLPVSYEDDSQIKGIAGSSAGAITALALAMGMNLEQVARETEPEIFKEKLTNDGDRRPGEFRTVIRKDGILVGSQGKAPSFQWIDKIERLVRHLAGKLGRAKIDEVMGVIKGGQLVHDLGYYSGFEARSFLTALVDTYFIRGDHYAAYRAAHPQEPLLSASTLTFKQFYNITKFRVSDNDTDSGSNHRKGFDLRVTGTNLTRNSPEIFSYLLTPNFPIVEAVGISMTIPFYFKPVEVGSVNFETQKPWDTERLSGIHDSSTHIDDRFSGLWVDGGMLNNLPIHAFDNNLIGHEGVFHGNYHVPSHGSETVEHDDIVDVRQVAGFRLEYGIDPDVNENVDSKDGLNQKWRDIKEKYDEHVENEAKKSRGTAGKIGAQLIDTPTGRRLKSYGTSMYNTMMWFSESGQIRNRAEYDRLTMLYSGLIDTLDFVPPVLDGMDFSHQPIEDAYKKTLMAFGY